MASNSPWRIEKTRGWSEQQAIFRNAPRAIQDLGRQWTKDVAADETRYIVKEAPSKTGTFRTTITPYAKAFTVGVTFQPYPKLGYKLVKWIRQGTPPHIIRAKNVSALRFVMGGKVRYAKLVHHPGTKPNEFVFRGARKFEQKRLNYWLGVLEKRIVKLLGGN